MMQDSENIDIDDNFGEDGLPEIVFDHGPDHANLKVLPAYYVLGFMLTSIILEILWGGSFFRWQIQLIGGVSFMALAIALFIFSVRTFIALDTPISPDQPTTNIVESGPYKFSRNPIYISFAIFYLGFALLFDMIWAFLLFIPMMYCLIEFSIKPEEAYLSRKFKDDYKDYAAQVRRWI